MICVRIEHWSKENDQLKEREHGIVTCECHTEIQKKLRMPNKNLQYKKTNKTTNTKLSLGYLYGNMLI